jgi:hypothetical protein
VFTEPLPCNDRGIHIQTHRLRGGFMKYAVEMGSGAMIYIPCFIKIYSGFQKLMGGDTEDGDRISLLLFLAYFPLIFKLCLLVNGETAFF